MIKVGDIVKFPVFIGRIDSNHFGFRLGMVSKIETHRGLHQYDISQCPLDATPVFAPRWMQPNDFQVMSDADLMIWMLENTRENSVYN